MFSNFLWRGKSQDILDRHFRNKRGGKQEYDYKYKQQKPVAARNVSVDFDEPETLDEEVGYTDRSRSHPAAGTSGDGYDGIRPDEDLPLPYEDSQPYTV